LGYRNDRHSNRRWLQQWPPDLGFIACQRDHNRFLQIQSGWMDQLLQPYRNLVSSSKYWGWHEGYFCSATDKLPGHALAVGLPDSMGYRVECIRLRAWSVFTGLWYLQLTRWSSLHQSNVFNFATGTDLCTGTYYETNIEVVSHLRVNVTEQFRQIFRSMNKSRNRVTVLLLGSMLSLPRLTFETINKIYDGSIKWRCNGLVLLVKLGNMWDRPFKKVVL